jgi:3-oxoacyl-[acyl-carrier protein] reductase
MTPATKPFAGKVALIAGRSRGIDAAVVREGPSVAFGYATSEDLAEALADDIQATDSRAVALRADQAVANDVENLVWETSDDFRRRDIFVSPASVYATGSVSDPSADI